MTVRYHLGGEKAGKVEVFAENLIGWPDNISPSSSGGYWVGIGLIRTPFVNYFADRFVFFRSFLAKVRKVVIETVRFHMTK